MITLQGKRNSATVFAEKIDKETKKVEYFISAYDRFLKVYNNLIYNLIQNKKGH